MVRASLPSCGRFSRVSRVRFPQSPRVQFVGHSPLARSIQGRFSSLCGLRLAHPYEGLHSFLSRTRFSRPLRGRLPRISKAQFYHPTFRRIPLSRRAAAGRGGVFGRGCPGGGAVWGSVAVVSVQPPGAREGAEELHQLPGLQRSTGPGGGHPQGGVSKS